MTIFRKNSSAEFVFDDSHASIHTTFAPHLNNVWADGVVTGRVAVHNDILYNLKDPTTGLWSNGTWVGAINFPPSNKGISGSRITWNAHPGVIVETSSNGTTWVAATNGDEPIGARSLSQGGDVYVRVKFPAEEATVTSLNLVLYANKYVYGTNADIVATITGRMTLDDKEYNPADLGASDGLLLKAGASLFIPSENEFGGTAAFEMVAGFDTFPADSTIFATGTSTIATNSTGQLVATNLTLYVDGVVVTSPYTMAPGFYHHIVATFPTSSLNLVFSASQRILYLATYYTAPTANEIAQLRATWWGSAPTRITDSSTIGISEAIYAATGQAVRGYTFAWSISSAG